MYIKNACTSIVLSIQWKECHEVMGEGNTYLYKIREEELKDDRIYTY